jgi:hypothetical protein
LLNLTGRLRCMLKDRVVEGARRKKAGTKEMPKLPTKILTIQIFKVIGTRLTILLQNHPIF